MTLLASTRERRTLEGEMDALGATTRKNEIFGIG